MTGIVIFGILGIICVGLEIFLPGGVLGLIGGALLLASVYFAYDAYGVVVGIITLAGLAVLAFVVFKAALKLAPRTKMGKALFLQDTQNGVNVSGDGDAELIGMEATAVSDLRPTGIIVLNGKRYNGITQGEYIDKNSTVKVVDFKNNRLLVAKETKTE